MKCVKSADNQVVRVVDSKAAELVKAGTHEYSRKKEWKESGRRR